MNTFEPDQRLAMYFRFDSIKRLNCAGDTFTLSDGTNVLTFELDDVNDNMSVQSGKIAVPFNTVAVDGSTGVRQSESAEEIAGRVASRHYQFASDPAAAQSHG